MRVASLMRPERRVPPPPPPIFTAATSADALSWTWTGAAVTAWRIKWGAAPGVYTGTYDVADANARAAMLSAFLTASGEYYVAVFAVDGGGEGASTNAVAISYTA